MADADWFYDNEALPDDKVNPDGFSNPVTNATRRWSANDINRTFRALRGLRDVLESQHASVLSFGAVGDGVADDTAAIQAAINATQGVPLYFPKGKYKFSTKLSILTRSHRLIGDFGGRFADGGTELSFTGTGPAIEIGQEDLINSPNWDTNWYGGPQDQVFENLWLSHSAPDTANGSGGNYKANAFGIWDWYGGGVMMRNVGLEKFEANFAGIQSDLNDFDGIVSLNSKFGFYIGPRSDQNTIRNLYSFFCDRAITIDRARDTTIETPKIVGCGTATVSAIEIRRGSAQSRVELPWFEHLSVGYNGVDQVSFVSVGEIDGYGAGGSIAVPGGTPTTTSVEGCSVHLPLVLTTAIGQPFHTKFIVTLGRCKRFSLQKPMPVPGVSLGNFDCFVVVPATQSPTSAETQSEITGVGSDVSETQVYRNLGGGTPKVAVWSSGGSGTILFDDVTIGRATGSSHSIRGATSLAAPAAAVNALGLAAANSNTEQAVGTTVGRFRQDGTYTPSGTVESVGCHGQSLSTRSGGGTLRNVGLLGQASGADQNVALKTTTGDVELNTTSGASIFSKSFRRSSELVPASIGANQNDYNPSGFSDAYAVILTSSGPFDITGFSSVANGREIWVYNNGANNITLKHQNAGSAAANRIIGRANADVVLTPAIGITLIYSPSITRWLVKADTL